MHQKQTIKTLGSDMFGGRQNFSTHDALMCQELTFNLQAHILKQGTIINLDDSKCFNKIYPNLENIALRNIGVHPNVETIFTENDNNMSHKISTHNGVIPPTLRADHHQNFSGIGQGNSAAGISWMATDSIIISAFQDQGFSKQTILDP